MRFCRACRAADFARKIYILTREFVNFAAKTGRRAEILVAKRRNVGKIVTGAFIFLDL